MTYQFDIDHAKQWGAEEAILLQNFIFWLRHNKANGKGLRDGRIWTYNSVRAFSVLFPFWSEKQIRRILESLVFQKVIIRGEYNLASYDKTGWYALVDENLLAIGPNGQMDLPERANGSAQMGKPIPDIKPDRKTRSLGSPPVHPEIREATDYYQEAYLGVFDIKPTWDGKIVKLLKADLSRMGMEMWKKCVRDFFDDPPAFVEKNQTGMGYNIFHSMIDQLIARKPKTEKPAGPRIVWKDGKAYRAS